MGTPISLAKSADGELDSEYNFPEVNIPAISDLIAFCPSGSVERTPSTTPAPCDLPSAVGSLPSSVFPMFSALNAF